MTLEETLVTEKLKHRKHAWIIKTIEDNITVLIKLMSKERTYISITKFFRQYNTIENKINTEKEGYGELYNIYIGWSRSRQKNNYTKTFPEYITDNLKPELKKKLEETIKRYNKSMPKIKYTPLIEDEEIITKQILTPLEEIENYNEFRSNARSKILAKDYFERYSESTKQLLPIGQRGDKYSYIELYFKRKDRTKTYEEFLITLVSDNDKTIVECILKK